MKTPIKKLKTLPNIPGITPDTAKHLKWKSVKYIFQHDTGRVILRHILKHPFRYAYRYLKSIIRNKSYTRDGDFFLYGVDSPKQFRDLLKNSKILPVIGFSYCQKPFECPSGRFTSECQYSPDHPVCSQCDIGQVLAILPSHAIKLLIPTIHYIGDQILSIVEANPKKEVLFLITACELTLEMFGDFGNMAGIRGIGVRLDGRICNTMKAFELSERGIKPGLTVVTETTQGRILELLG